MLLIHLLIALYIVVNVEAATRIDPLVDTKLGLIRGLKSSDGQYSMFMGIPFATIDKDNPFGPSTPHQGFEEVFEAYDDTAICPQVEEFSNTVAGTLDCLHLNVYVPNSASSQNRLPVLVWIYGGGFSTGYAGRYIYGPSYIVRHDIILVTLNYRLGPYGFMSLDTPEVPGNQGLKDQRTALKWVKDNIESFGGDSNKITIFGESAGGASVDLHLHYRHQGERLFNQVLMQSGSALAPWAFHEPDPSAPLTLAVHLGFETSDINEALSFLATVDAKLVIAATTELGLSFMPSIEKHSDEDQSFARVHPIYTQLSNIEEMPILIGFNNREGLLFIENEDSFLNENIFQNYLVDYFNLEQTELTEMEEIIRHFYVGDESLNENTALSIIDFLSDTTINYGVERSVQKYLDHGAGHIYHYVFSYDGQRNFAKIGQNITESGAAHADEIGYLFDLSYMQDVPTTTEDQTIIDRITTLWANFVKYGNPTPDTSDLLPVAWPPVSRNALSYLDIDSEMTIKQRPFHNRMAFWDLFYKLNENAQKDYQS